jgi:hypothetical protein
VITAHVTQVMQICDHRPCDTGDANHDAELALPPQAAAVSAAGRPSIHALQWVMLSLLSRACIRLSVSVSPSPLSLPSLSLSLSLSLCVCVHAPAHVRMIYADDLQSNICP